MNKRDRDDHEPLNNAHPAKVTTDTALEERITRSLHEQAMHVHFTPQLRAGIMHRLSPRQRTRPSLLFAAASATALVLVVALAFTSYLLLHAPAPQQSVNYTLASVTPVPAQLANGGHLISLDPTGQHLVYQPAGQPGVMYTTDVAEPVARNLLAMRYARDAAWAPDGSALVATVAPEGTFAPLLALVPNGKYMHLLGHDALAAAWSSSNKELITYVMQINGSTQLWGTTPTGQPAQHIATMGVSLLVQHLSWSPRGQQLALVVSVGTLAESALQQPGRAIYVMDAKTNSLRQLVSPGNFTIGTIDWSPDGRYLAYERVDAQQKITVQIMDVSKQQNIFSIVPQHALQGWDWSPDSRALVYSDGGVLSTHVFHGAAITFPRTAARHITPFWLKDGRILCMQIDHGVGKLALLQQQK